MPVQDHHASNFPSVGALCCATWTTMIPVNDTYSSSLIPNGLLHILAFTRNYTVVMNQINVLISFILTIVIDYQNQFHTCFISQCHFSNLLSFSCVSFCPSSYPSSSYSFSPSLFTSPSSLWTNERQGYENPGVLRFVSKVLGKE